MESENNQSSNELQQSLAETHRLLREFAPAWKRIVHHCFSQTQTQPQPSSSQVSPYQPYLPNAEQGSASEPLRGAVERNIGYQANIINYFHGLTDTVLIEIDPATHQITLSFAVHPEGRFFQPIKHLCLFSCCWLLRQKNPTEFTFGFAKVCDLKAIATATAIDYQALGYRCCIRCEEEVMKVEQWLAKHKTSALDPQTQEVVLCA
jgi:hypothetical protein